MFRDSKSLVENQTRKKIKILRTNNGGEYSSNDFKYLCRDVEIKGEVIVPYNPQQNGVVERKNKTILE
ncbi:transposase family protein, partial [Vibrio cholerae O1]|nr:transposase family protein [Vibrio cholerae O1]